MNLTAVDGPLKAQAFELRDDTRVGDEIQLRGEPSAFKINPFHEDVHDALCAIYGGQPITPITPPMHVYCVLEDGLHYRKPAS